MQEELIALFAATKNPETVAESSQRLMEIMNNPDVFQAFFEIIQNPAISFDNKKSAAVYIKVALNQNMNLSEEGINPEVLAFVKSQLLEILFSINDHNLKDIIIGSMELILKTSEGGLDSWPELFTSATGGMTDGKTVSSAIALLSLCMEFIPENTIAESLEQLAGLADEGIKYNEWPVRVSAFEILHKIAKYIIDAGGDISSQIASFLSYPHDAVAFSVNSYLFRIWVIINDFSGNDFVSDEQKSEIFAISMEIARNEAIDVFTRMIILSFNLSVVPLLDEAQLNEVLDINFQLAIKIIEETSNFDPLLVQIIEECLSKLDQDAIFEMLKDRITTVLESEDANGHVFCFYVISELLLYAPEAARGNFEFIQSALETYIESENTNVKQAVCYALDSLDETFVSAQVIASSMLLKVLQLTLSEDADLRTSAFNTAHCLCQLLDTDVEDFFNFCIQNHEELSTPENFESFASIFADAFSRTDVDDGVMEQVIEYVSNFLGEEVDIDNAAPALIIISAILQKDEARAETLLGPAMELANRALDSTNDQTKINAFDFISEIFGLFSEAIMTNFRIIPHKIRSIAKSICDTEGAVPEEVKDEEEEEEQLEPPSEDEEQEAAQPADEEEEDDDETTRDTVRIAAIETSSIIAKTLKSKRYSKELQECIITALNLDETISSMYDSAKRIAKFLGRSDALQLFLNLNDIILFDKNPRTVSDALNPYTKLIKYACPKNKDKFLENAITVVSEFFDGNLPSTKKEKPLEGRCDYVLMTNIAYLITEIVKVPNPEIVDQICAYMLEIISVPGHIASYSFLAAFTDAIQYDSCSQEKTQELLSILGDLIGSAEEPDIMQNICYLLNVLAKKNQALVSSIMEYLPAINEWYSQSIEQENGYQNLISNIGSLYMTLANFVPDFPEELTVVAFEQYPPYDTTETSSMTDMILKFFQSHTEFSGPLLSAAVLAISRLLVLTDIELQECKITQQQYDAVKQLFKTIVSSNQAVSELIQTEFAQYSTKLAKLSQILEQQ